MCRKFEITGCIDCPFMYSEYDEYSLGSNTTDICSLSMFLQQEDYFIDCRDAGDANVYFNTPIWCPIENEILIKKLK